MPIAEYKGPANHTGIFKHLIGETIKASFVDYQGHVWLITPSDYALVFAGFDGGSQQAFWIEAPDQVRAAVEKRRGDLQAKIQELRHLVPGIDL